MGRFVFACRRTPPPSIGPVPLVPKTPPPTLSQPLAPVGQRPTERSRLRRRVRGLSEARLGSPLWIQAEDQRWHTNSRALRATLSFLEGRVLLAVRGVVEPRSAPLTWKRCWAR